MSFIVKGIDLPKDGESIRLVITSSGDVVETWRDGLAKAYHPNKAIQIPKGHGRIGDLGKLAKLIAEFGESLKESVIRNRLLMTERDICYAIAVLTEHFQEYEPLLETEEEQ